MRRCFEKAARTHRHRTIVEYTEGQTMHIFHPKDFQDNYVVDQGWNPEAVAAVVFFPGGGFRNCASLLANKLLQMLAMCG